MVKVPRRPDRKRPVNPRIAIFFRGSLFLLTVGLRVSPARLFTVDYPEAFVRAPMYMQLDGGCINPLESSSTR